MSLEQWHPQVLLLLWVFLHEIQSIISFCLQCFVLYRQVRLVSVPKHLVRNVLKKLNRLNLRRWRRVRNEILWWQLRIWKRIHDNHLEINYIFIIVRTVNSCIYYHMYSIYIPISLLPSWVFWFFTLILSWKLKDK